MLDLDTLYESSPVFKALLDETEDALRNHLNLKETIPRARAGLKAWDNLLTVMEMLEADSEGRPCRPPAHRQRRSPGSIRGASTAEKRKWR